MVTISALMLGACGTAGSMTPAGKQEGGAATPSPAADAKPRTIVHAAGQTIVPAKVERVVTLTPHLADHLLSLGMKPVGSVVREAGDFEPYIGEQLKGTESVGQSASPNLEKVLQLKPDLILGEEKNHSKPYEALSKMAPTIVYANKEMEQDWTLIYKKVAEAVGKQDLAEAKLKEFDAKTKGLKEKLTAKLGNETVVFFKVTDKDTRVMGSKSSLGKIAYEQLGLKYPAGLPEEEGEIKLALEKLPEINPDYIFLLDVNVPDYADKLNEALETPIWKSLKAVQNNHVYKKPLRATKTGFGLVMHNIFVDEIQKELLGQ
ncbi:iron-siderophore ABC transporter substrate-binding protein [Paenibacillus sp. y28]